MPFWSTNFGADATLKDPKRKFRFTVEFTGINATPGGSLLWYAKSVDKPKFTIANVNHKFINHTFYYPGSVEWQEINVVMVDPVDPDMTATFSDMVVASGYSPPANSNSLGSISKAKAATALGSVIITQIDADGNPLETWTLWNAFLTKMESDELSYGDDELSATTVGLRYDWATVETANGSSAVIGSGGNEFFRTT